MGEHLVNNTAAWAESGTNTPIRGISRSLGTPGSHRFETLPKTEWNATRQVASGAAVPPSSTDRPNVREELTTSAKDFFDNVYEDDDERDAYIVSFMAVEVWP